MEQLRKKFMASPHHWGASPLSSPSGSSDSRERWPFPDTNLSANAPLAADALDELIMADASARIKPRSSAAERSIPTCQGWTLESLISSSPNFRAVPRVRWSPMPSKSLSDKIIEFDAEKKGTPLVVEGLHNHPRWIKDKFTPEWLLRKGEISEISARNIHTRTDHTMSLADFLNRSRQTCAVAAPGETERFYGKDVQCPEEWETFLNESGVVPSFLAPSAHDNLLNNLPKADQPETLMCYLGVGDTFTPCHKDLCASSGHNLMTYTENGGSSFWFMTATSSAGAAALYFHNKLKQELDHEAHVVTIEELAAAPFDVYITEQKLGDLVLVPPRSAHQVVNSGGITVKTSWSRMTLDGLTMALRWELPLYRRVCRVETYRVKSTIYHTLRKTIRRARKQPRNDTSSRSTEQVSKKLETLLRLFDTVLQEEWQGDDSRRISVLSEEEIGHLSCDFCGADIFQSFFECRTCVPARQPGPRGHSFHICSGCYVEGRSCRCEVMTPMFCRSFNDLLDTRKQGIELLAQLQPKAKLKSNQQLLASNTPSLFRAALVLLMKREHSKADEKRRCTVRRDKELNHDVRFADSPLTCNKCHSATCLAHLLFNDMLHAVEALIVHDTDDKTHAAFHECHRGGKDRYSWEIQALKGEESSYLPDPRIQLAYLANTYSVCQPIHPDAELRKAGFYDLAVWDYAESNIKSDSHPSNSAAPAMSSQVPAAKAQKRERVILDCVEILKLSRAPKRTEGGVVEISRAEFTDRSRERQRIAPEPVRRPKGPPGVRGLPPSGSSRGPVASSSRKKVSLPESTSEPESDDDEPRPKRPRVAKSGSDLRFAKGAAASVADAYNSVFNGGSKAAAPPPPPRHSSSSTSSTPPLPRKTAKRKAAPPAATAAAPVEESLPQHRRSGAAAPIADGSLPAGVQEGLTQVKRLLQEFQSTHTAQPAAPSSSTLDADRGRPAKRKASERQESSSHPAHDAEIESKLADIMQILEQVQDTQARQSRVVNSGGSSTETLVRALTGALAAERQSSNADTVKAMGEIFAQFIPFMQHPRSNLSLGYAPRSRNWVPLPRAQGRQWGSAMYVDHQASQEYRGPALPPPQEAYSPYWRGEAREHHYSRYPTQHASTSTRRPTDIPSNIVYERRSWPDDSQDQNWDAPREPRKRAHQYLEEGRESRETRTRRTRHTSPTSSNALDLIQRPGPRSVQNDAHDTGSDASTNGAPSANTTNTTSPSVSPPKPKTKFFPVAARERPNTPTPNWEDNYEMEEVQ